MKGFGRSKFPSFKFKIKTRAATTTTSYKTREQKRAVAIQKWAAKKHIEVSEKHMEIAKKQLADAKKLEEEEL
ncbi:MAG: hypothetical protein AUI92_05370 [Thaumarchaeota archaeon 13_1_40CM_3_38_6]|nr:MAG: hypothetical protein AUI92_05370 [Thaumarchaeota archaeon 13_1_40CM_3_38_6]